MAFFTSLDFVGPLIDIFRRSCQRCLRVPNLWQEAQHVSLWSKASAACQSVHLRNSAAAVRSYAPPNRTPLLLFGPRPPLSSSDSNGLPAVPKPVPQDEGLHGKAWCPALHSQPPPPLCVCGRSDAGWGDAWQAPSPAHWLVILPSVLGEWFLVWGDVLREMRRGGARLFGLHPWRGPAPFRSISFPLNCSPSLFCSTTLIFATILNRIILSRQTFSAHSAAARSTRSPSAPVCRLRRFFHVVGACWEPVFSSTSAYL